MVRTTGASVLTAAETRGSAEARKYPWEWPLDGGTFVARAVTTPSKGATILARTVSQAYGVPGTGTLAGRRATGSSLVDAEGAALAGPVSMAGTGRVARGGASRPCQSAGSIFCMLVISASWSTMIFSARASACGFSPSCNCVSAISTAP